MTITNTKDFNGQNKGSRISKSVHWKHILICGLPGTGKTPRAKELAYYFHVPHYNADTLRGYYGDWDFSYEGRITQASRMSRLPFGILDFVCPTNALRELVSPDFIIWMNTKESSKYEDTNNIWQDPANHDIEVLQWIEASNYATPW